MNKNIIRKLFHKVGLDLHRHYVTPSRISFLKTLNIGTVIDVGANVGQFAGEIRGILPDAFIYSFEPLSACYEQLKKNMQKDANFKAFNFALGNSDETSVMQKSSYTPSSSLLHMTPFHKTMFPHTKDATPETISIKRFDNLSEFSLVALKKEILVKIDTQGYEAEVIAGAKNLLSISKAVIVETSYTPLYENQPLFADIYRLLTSLGFIYKGSIQEKINQKTGEIIFEDSLFVR